MTNFNLYKTFIAVAKHKNITKASEELLISQPALTLQIKQLEENLGGELFVRKNKGVELTMLGQMLFEKANSMVEQMSNLENIGKLQAALELGILRIGSSSSNCNQIIAKYLIKFVKIYPNLKITMIRGTSESLLEKLEKNLVDIIFTDTAEFPVPYECVKKFPVEYQLIGNIDYFNKFKNTAFDKSEYLKSSLILPNERNNSRKYIDVYCRQNGIKITPKYELDNYKLVYEFVKNGLGIAFVSLEYYQDKINAKEVYPLSPSTKIKIREFSVYINPNFLNPAKDQFIKILND